MTSDYPAGCDFPDGNVLQSTAVTLDSGNYLGLISVSYYELVLLTQRRNQTERVRHYSWPYEKIKSVMISDDRKLFIDLDTECPLSNVKVLDLCFFNRQERDQFGFKIKMMARLYKNKSRSRSNSESGQLEASQAASSSHDTGRVLGKNYNEHHIQAFLNTIPDIPDKGSARNESEGELSREGKETGGDVRFLQDTKDFAQKLIPFKVEPSSSDEIPELPDDDRSVMPSSESFDASRRCISEQANCSLELGKAKVDDMFSVENLIKLSELTIDQLTASKLASTTRILVPLEIKTDGDQSSVRAEAKLALSLSLDMAALMEAQKVEDRDERLRELRKLIQLDTSLCELCFV